MTVVGVVPAAGRAIRLQPLSGSKEVVAVRGRPIMDHLIERMRAAGCDEIRIVTRPQKVDVARHAEQVGARVIFGSPTTVAESLALGMRGVAQDSVVLFGFPDTLWEPVGGFAMLAAELPRCEVALGVFRSRQPTRADVVVLGDGGEVEEIAVKPPRPRSNLVWGCLAARAGALAGVDRHAEVSDHLRHLRLRAIVFDSDFVDVGTREALAAVGATA